MPALRQLKVFFDSDSRKCDDKLINDRVSPISEIEELGNISHVAISSRVFENDIRNTLQGEVPENNHIVQLYS